MTQNEINELIVHHIGFSEKVARLNCKKYPRISFDELCSAAYMGLVIAANKYNANRETKFTTYAHLKINFSILMYAKENYPIKKKTIYESDMDKSVMEGLTVKIQKPERHEICDILTTGLNQQEKEIFVDYYVNGKRAKEIAVEQKVDNSRISQILKKITKKLTTKWNDNKCELYAMIS